MTSIYRDNIKSNIEKLEAYAGEDNWGEFSVSTDKHFLLYDTTGYDYFVRVSEIEGELFTVWLNKEVELKDLIGVWFFFEEGHHEEIMGEIVKYTKR